MFCRVLVPLACFVALSVVTVGAQYTRIVEEGNRVSDGLQVGPIQVYYQNTRGEFEPGKIDCNPLQQYNDLPASGGVLQDFYSTYFSATTTIDSYVRAALYEVTGGLNYTMLAATSAASDIFVPARGFGSAQIGSSKGPGSLYYPNNGTSATVYANRSYAICFHTTGPDFGSNRTVLFAWPNTNSTTMRLGYQMSDPMPATLTPLYANDATYMLWMTLLVNTTIPPVAVAPITGLQLGSLAPPAGTVAYPVAVVSTLRCNPVQQFNSLPAGGTRLTSFSTVYSPSLTYTDGGIVRAALYTVVNGIYTLVAGTNASSDLHLPQGPIIVANVTSIGPLYYPSGDDRYYVLPNITYALCFHNNDQLLLNGYTAQFYFPSGTTAAILSTTYNVSQRLPVTATAVSTSVNAYLVWMNVALASSSVLGDPQFVGLQAQSYQVHGVDGLAYGLISDSMVAINGLFKFLDEGRCLYDENRQPLYVCWSHPGSYIAALSIRTKHGDTIEIRSGSGSAGFDMILVNAAPFRTIGDTVMLSGGLELFRQDIRTIRVRNAGLYHLTIQNSDGFLNILKLQVSSWSQLVKSVRSHGLVGQTWKKDTKGEEVREVEGRVDDYVVDGGLMGCEFVYSVMRC